MVEKLPSDGYKTLRKVYSGEGPEYTHATLEFQRLCPARPGMMSARLIATSQPLYNFARIDNGE